MTTTKRDAYANSEEPAHLPPNIDENLATAIRQAATHIHEALTRDPEDFKNSLDLTK